jgi:putative tryptophan/tyrosine transport system substrate-binding protein
MRLPDTSHRASTVTGQRYESSARRATAFLACAVALAGGVLDGCGRGEQLGVPVKRAYRIGFAYFSPEPACDNAIAGVLKGLAEEGIVEGKNLEVIKQHAFGEIANLPTIMQSLESRGVDLIVPMSTPGVAAAAATIRTTPVVFVYTYDPLGAGAGRSLTDHLPNFTGVASFPPIGSTMAFIRETVPGVRTIGTVYNPGEANSVRAVRTAREALAGSGVELVETTVAGTNEVMQAALAILARGPQVLWITGDNTVIAALEGVLKPAADARVPVVLNDPEFVDRGALAAFGISWAVSGREAGKLAARVLRGESPRDIPIIDMATPAVVLNHAVASRLGITFPAAILASAQKPAP